MASHDTCPGPGPSKFENDRNWSHSSQEIREDRSLISPFLPIDPELIQADPIGSGNGDQVGSKDLSQYSGTLQKQSIPYPVLGTASPSSVAVPVPGANKIHRQSPGPSLANTSMIGDGQKVRKRVFLKSEEERTQLVRLCIANFGDFAGGKERFWSKISLLYQQLHSDGVAPNVKGYMQRYSVQRQKELVEASGKSGIAESATEWQQAMDYWLELVRDFEAKSKGEKGLTAKGDEVRKKEVATLRENMTKSFMRKRGLPEAVSTSENVGESGGNQSEIQLSESNNQSGNIIPQKKPRYGFAGAEPEGDRVFTSQRRTTDRILNSLREGDQEMLRQIREMELEKMNHWKEIFGGSDREESQQLGKRIEQLEKQGEEMQETLTNIVSLLQGLKHQFH